MRALVASPSVKRLHAFFKYGYLAIEEHFWAIALDPVWKSTSVSGAPRQFNTKSFLGDDAAVLARSSGEEPASPRHRAGVASMAWRTTR